MKKKSLFIFMSISSWLAMLAFLFWWGGAAEGIAHTAVSYDLSTASFWGDETNNDIRGTVIQSDGTVVLAANTKAGGMLIHLTPDGQTVQKETRVGARVLDLSLDGQDNLSVALWSEGVTMLDPTAESVLWQKSLGNVMRLDTAVNGDTAVLVTTSDDPDSNSPGNGLIYLYDADGTLLTNFAGHRNTLDVCVDHLTQRVIHIGWNQASSNLQVAYLRGRGYEGDIKWTAYDWAASQVGTSTSDTRGYRCDVGGDNKLYATFEVAGGTHIFRYMPFDMNQSAPLVGGNQWHEFYNTSSEHKTIFARYEPATGAYLLGQRLTNRLSSGRGNTIVTRAITADEHGRVYLGGYSAAGLPLPPAYNPQGGATVFEPFSEGTYSGGAWVMVLSNDFRTRLYHTRLATNGRTLAVGARQLSPFYPEVNFVWAGFAGNTGQTYVQDALQPTAVGGERDGHFAVIAPFTNPPPPPSNLTEKIYLPLLLR